MPCRLSFLLLFTLLAAPLAAQEKTEPDIKALWATGCLWEVGDNPAKVKKAREDLIALGEPAMQHALTRLDSSDGLEIRCLSAVFAGWKEKGFESLVANISHEKPWARRNVADLLAQLDDPRAAQPLLERAKVEDNDPARIAQLIPLAKWKIDGVLPVLIEASQSKNDRVRGRVPSLLAMNEHPLATQRLVKMMAEPTYHVADAALAAMKNASFTTREACLAHLREHLDLPAADQPVQLMRRLLAVAPGVALEKTPGLIIRALSNENAGVRADAALALVAWKAGAGLLDDKVDVSTELGAALVREADPFARAAMKRVIEKLAETGKSG